MLLILTIGFTGRSDAANVASCYAGRLPIFAVQAKTSAPLEERKYALMNACGDLSKPQMLQARTHVGNAVDVAATAFGGGLAGHWASKFSTLNGSLLQRNYRAEIARIRKTANPIERVREAYILAGTHSGEYDDEGSFPTLKSGYVVMMETPENLLNNFEKRGTVGVCREFASLLQWTLEQVARPMKAGRLGAREFTASNIGGRVAGSGGLSDGGQHAWVRVKFASGLKFDLDTTWFPKEFTPLAPRRSGLSAAYVRRAIDECQAISACLETL